MKKDIFLGCALQLLLVTSLVGQSEETESPVSVAASVSRNTITVGDPFELTIEAVYDRNTVVQMPGSEIKLGEFELLDHRHAPLSEDPQGAIIARSTYRLTAFSTGDLEIPPLTLRYRVADQEEQTITLEPISIAVESVLADDVEDIRDIKPPLEIPRDWLSLLVALVAGAVVLILALLLWKRFRSAARPETADLTPDLPPHIAAYRALNRLSNSGLLDQGEILRFHVELSEIVRRYFGGRFGIDALEMTSQELLFSLPKGISPALPQNLLRQCDLVKFAKFKPSRTQSEDILEMAYDIVESTKPRPEEIASTATSDQDENAEVKQVELERVEGG